MKGKKDRELSKRPEKYDTMSVEGAPIFHPTDDSKVPGRIIERKPGKKPRWDYFPKDGHPYTEFEPFVWHNRIEIVILRARY